MVGNHLLVKMKWSDHVQKNSNDLDLRLAVSYFQTKRDNVIIYMGMNLLLNKINKDSEIHTIIQILSPSTMHNQFLALTSQNGQQSKYAT